MNFGESVVEEAQRSSRRSGDGEDAKTDTRFCSSFCKGARNSDSMKNNPNWKEIIK
jgi:hypothetical protein